MPDKKIDPEFRASALENAEATLSTLREQIDDLTAKLARVRARGTRDMPRQATPAPPVGAPASAAQAEPDLASKIEALLRERSMSLDELVRACGSSPGRVGAALRQLRQRVHNVGSADRPRWTWVVGDETDTPSLISLVERLLREQPMYTAEIAAATGARVKRVDGAIVQLQRRRLGVRNLGTPRRARWFVVPPEIRR